MESWLLGFGLLVFGGLISKFLLSKKDKTLKIFAPESFVGLKDRIELLKQDLEQGFLWTISQKDEGIEISSKNEPAVIRAETIIPASFGILFNFLAAIDLYGEWDPHVNSSKKIGACFDNEGGSDLYEVSFNLTLTAPIHLSKLTWRSPDNKEAIILLRETTALSPPAKGLLSRYVPLFAYSIRAIDEHSCLVTHLLQQTFQEPFGMFGMAENVRQASTRMKDLANLFKSGTSTISERVKQVSTCMPHLTPGFKVVRLRNIREGTTILHGVISQYQEIDCTTPPMSSFPRGPSKTASSTSSTNLPVTKEPSSSSSENDFERSADGREQIEVLIPNRGRGLLLIGQAKDACKRFITEIKREGWESLETFEGVAISQKMMPDSSVPAALGKGTIAASPKAILKAIIQTETRKAWDLQIEKIEVVEKINFQTKIIHATYQPGWLLSKRDFVFIEYWEKIGDVNYVVAYADVSHKSYPETSEVIRGRLIMGGFLIKSVQPSPPVSEVLYMAHCEQKGNMMSSIENRIATRMPRLIVNLRDFLPKNPIFNSMPSQGTPSSPIDSLRSLTPKFSLGAFSSSDSLFAPSSSTEVSSFN